MTLHIRPALPADAALIATLIHELADYEQLSHECHVTAENIAITLFSAKPDAESVIAERDGSAVGFALFFHNFSTFSGKRGLYLEDLYVRPEARGRGVGKALLAHLARLAVARGCGRFEWTVLDWNAPAIAFYESLGAEAKKEWIIHRVTGEALTRLAAQAAP